ncbi:hypothetical protein KORDIASMS9_03779 [Kordia sp. SMS9]|uniref:phage tail protein n=1 Tax=Kordia sp. SMS9 TaxID=2282170 RepID=UPI000E0CC5C8|nr:hypothetical protein [Kordia sp. SMS9]AXG71522.1 hypothetical protein KORDIASMS9_03779 [Kordia sp. SMS9]
MNTARAQKGTTEKSKGNSAGSSTFIAPKKNKKKQKKATDETKVELFIVAKSTTESSKTNEPATPTEKKAKGKKASGTFIAAQTPKSKKSDSKKGETNVGVGKKKKGEKKASEAGKTPKGKEAAKKEYKVIKTPSKPEKDKAFQDTLKHIKGVKEEQEVHPPGEAKAAEVKAAAVLPAQDQQQVNDRATHYASMESTSKVVSKKKFTKDTFKAALKKELEALEENLPTDEAGAEKFKKDKPLDKVKGNVNSNVTAEKDKVAGPLATDAKDPNPPKSTTPTVEAKALPVDAVGKQPKPINKKSATPKPKHRTEISMEKESDSLDDFMAENKISDSQLSNANEPKFSEALDSKNKAQDEAKKAPKTYRKKENVVLGEAKLQAGKEGTDKLGAMHAMRSTSFKDVLGAQNTNESADKLEQKRINKEFTKIYDKTKEAVGKRLDKISTDVDAYFEEGGAVEQAKKSFEKRVEKKLGDIYGWTTIDDSIASFFAGEDVNAGEIERVFQMEKQIFINKLDKIFDKISGIIATGLNESMTIIETGRKETDTFYKGLSDKQKELAKDSLDTFNDKYTDLEDTVASKEQELAQDLAKKYKENVDSLRATFDEIKERVSSSWLEAAFNFLKGIVETILKIKDMLFTLIAALVDAITAIITDPIGFLKNLFMGIKLGFEYFFSNIKTHLITGLIEWLTGSLGGVGITIPDNLFSLKGIFNLVMQILGLTWDYFRSKAVKLLGETVVAGMEKAVEVFTIIKEKGVNGLWEYIKEQFSDLKEMVMDAIRDMIITKVVEAGIKWIMGLLSPAGAFVKAAMLIIDVIRFFIERAAQIFELVTAFINGIKALAAGGIETLARSIEKALAKTLPILIGFLAALVGITGLTGKVQKIIKRVRKRIDKAINKVIKKAKKAFKGLVKKGKAKVKDIATKLIGWLKFKNKFKSKDGGNHTLFIKKKGKKQVFYVASDPTPVEKFLKDKKSKEKDKTKKGNIGKALTYYQKTVIKEENDVLNKEKAYKVEPDKKKKRSKRYEYQKATEKLRKTMQTFANKLSTLEFGNENDETVRTKITKKKKGGRAGNVKAWPLTYLPGEYTGSTPKEKPPGWTGYAQDATDKWVRGHFLSEQLHGPGVNWNMAPISQSANSQMETIEHKMIPKIKEQGKFYYYITDATYDDSRTGEDKNIPTKIRIASGELKRKEGTTDKFVPKTKGASVPITVGLPNLGGPPNLNVVGRPTLTTKGITKGLAEDILKCRDKFKETNGGFDDLNDLISSMKLMYSDALTPKEGGQPSRTLARGISAAHIAQLTKIIEIDQKVKIE